MLWLEPLGLRSVEKGIYGDNYVLEHPMPPIPLVLRTMEFQFFQLSGSVWTNAHVEIKICDQTALVPDGLTDPCGGTVIYQHIHNLLFDFGGGPTNDLPSGYLYTYADFFRDAAENPIDVDFTALGYDPDVFWTWKYTEGATNSVSLKASPGFVSGRGPQVGSSAVIAGDQARHWTMRDQDLNGRLELDPGLEPDLGCVNPEPNTCDRRRLAAAHSDLVIHLRGMPDPRIKPPGGDLFTTAPCSGWDIVSGIVAPGLLDFDDEGNDCRQGNGSSDEFTGDVPLVGLPLVTHTADLGATDTIVDRGWRAILPNPGDMDSIPVEVAALSLSSAEPITITRGDGAYSERWMLKVCLSERGQGESLMTLTQGACAEGGGTWTTELNVVPRLIFYRVGGGPRCEVSYDFGVFGMPAVPLEGSGYWFDGDVSGLGLVEETTGVNSVDGNCNGYLEDAAHLATSGVKIGVQAIDACAPGQAPAARASSFSGGGVDHPVCPTLLNQTDTDGDGVPDGCDNCPLDVNPCQEDSDDDGFGEPCQLDCSLGGDSDGDGVCCAPGPLLPFDNCCDVVNPDQTDTDGDGQGDICDACPNDSLNDFDGDGLCCADQDGDGTVDDACCFSNLNGTVITPDGCDSGVPSALFGSGCTMNDLVARCAAAASTHGESVSCISHLTNDWKDENLITGRQKSRIVRCAAHSNPNPASLNIRTVNERGP